MGSSTLGEGNDFGFFIGFGLGLTLEVLVLHTGGTAANV
jgi:chalcone synthase